MKASAIIRIILYTLLFLTLLGILIAGIVAGEFISNISFGSAGGNVASVGSVPANQIKNLDIEWAAGSVTIQTADVDEISFAENEGLTEKQKMVWKQYSDTLSLQFGKSNVIFGISFGTDINISKDLVITVPKEWNCDELIITGAAVEVDISGLTVDRIDLDGAAAELNFNGSLSELECDGAAAELTLNCTNSPDRISIDGAACALDLTLPADCGFAVDTDGLAIDFRSDCDYTVSNGSYAFGNGQCKVRISGLGCQISIDQSEICNHIWDKGDVRDVPGDERKELVYTCTVCSETKSEPYDNSGNFKVSYANTFTQDMLLEPLMTGYSAGTNVTVKTDILTDEDLELYVDGVFICRQTEVPTDETHHWEFSFIMPDHDVAIQLKTSDGM